MTIGPNPYAPPSTDIDSSASPADPQGELASLWQRLGGSLLDTLIYGLSTGIAYVGVSFTALAEAQKTSSNPFLLFTMAGTWGIAAVLLWLATFVMQATLLTKRGQSVGKIVAGTRVVRLDGSRAPFVNVVVLRTFVVTMMYFVPKVGPVLSIADSLFIFGKSRRCLHDRIAGTKVIKVTPSAG